MWIVWNRTVYVYKNGFGIKPNQNPLMECYQIRFIFQHRKVHGVQEGGLSGLQGLDPIGQKCHQQQIWD